VAIAQLLRLPNVFTAVADVMMGYLVARPLIAQVPLPHEFRLEVGLLVAASALLYTAGMVLNDLFDAAADARDRPKRPIPSGRITLRTAWQVGVGLLAAGTLFGWLAAVRFSSPRTALVVTCLAGCVVLYDRFLKPTPAGPLAMGGCRSLNVLLGMSLAPTPWGQTTWLIAGGIGIYAMGITYLARSEATTSRRMPLVWATAVLLTGLALLAALPLVHSITIPTDRWRLFWLLLAALIAWRCLRAIVLPEPATVQRAVRQAIHALIVIDAALCCGVQGVFWALTILALILPTLALAVRVEST
jgi:4-hydroxybenzoate polyprenyltransferase